MSPDPVSAPAGEGLEGSHGKTVGSHGVDRAPPGGAGRSASPGSGEPGLSREQSRRGTVPAVHVGERRGRSATTVVVKARSLSLNIDATANPAGPTADV